MVKGCSANKTSYGIRRRGCVVRIAILLLCISIAVVGCVKPKAYVSPTIDPSLGYSANEVADKDGKGLSFSIPGHTTPLIDNAGGWKSANKSDMIWLDSDRIAFVGDVNKANTIFFLNTVSGDIYPCEDEIQHQEIRDAVSTYRLNWFRSTDRSLTGGQQLLKKMSTTGSCRGYEEHTSAEVKSVDENESTFIIKVEKFVGVEVEDRFTKRVICEYRDAGSYCGILASRTSPTNDKIGLCPQKWATLSLDGKYMLSDAGLLDLEARQYLTEGALIDQKPSTPPVLLAYTVAPAFDRVAILYGYPDRYVVDVVSFSLPTQ